MSTYQAHARRGEKAAAKRELRAGSDLAECPVCLLTHTRPGEAQECPECGGAVCYGMAGVCVCGSSSEVSGKLRDATEKAGDALAGVPARGDIFTPSKRRSHAA